VKGLAARQDLVHLGPALGEVRLAAIEPADVAVLAIGAEDRVDHTQPVKRRVDAYAGTVFATHVDADRHPHDVPNLDAMGGGHRLSLDADAGSLLRARVGARARSQAILSQMPGRSDRGPRRWAP